MPTYLRADGFVVRIHGPPREHPPPHVHVHRGVEGVAVVGLRRGPDRPHVWLRAALGLTNREIVAAVRLVEQHAAELIAHWEKLHGIPTSD